ncbi:MAG: sensor histidine kinase [Planctomycetota bacterium]|jgi:signal transduction histidine kinase
MNASRRWWLLFGLGTAVVLGAMTGISVVLLGLEDAERRAREAAEYQESLRLSLWRMDSWLAPRLATEAARPYFEYVSYYPQERAYTRILNAIEPGEVLTPSPLLTFESEHFSLHFQVATDGTISSPQVPTGNLRDLAESTLLDAERIGLRAAELLEIATLLDRAELRPRVLAIEQCVTVATDALTNTPAPLPPPPQIAQEELDMQQLARNKAEWSQRTRSTGEAQRAASQARNEPLQLDAAFGQPAVRVGPFVPIWLGASPAPAPPLLYLRRVQIAGSEMIQGFLVDWSRLQADMLAQIGDLIDHARLLPVAADAPGADPAVLATIPALLDVTRGSVGGRDWPTAGQLTIAIAWLVVLVAIVAAGVGLRASVAYGERRSRFASAVTHELRTPLTTFQLYSEMLADGMVKDEQRTTYLRTLKQEADRLGTLVENVLAYARLERGNGTTRRDAVPVASLLDQLTPRLRDRAAAGGLRLESLASVADDAVVRVDVEAVGQILLNLVDNACKYAADGDEQMLELRAAAENGHLALTVRDHGHGIPRACVGQIFVPFERGRDQATGETPGIGLGLALSRGLARDLGGDLRLSANGTDGACFELVLPLE